MFENLTAVLKKSGFVPYPDSLRDIEGGKIFVARRGGEKLVGIVGNLHGLSSPTLTEKLPTGETVRLYPLDWANYQALKRLLPITPSPCDREASFGTGDRLGIASAAHLEVLQRYPVFPVIAQQSPRELQKCNRDFQDVLLKAVLGVLETGFTGAFGADADHIKDEEHLMMGARADYSMYTLDVSDWLQDPTGKSADSLSTLSRKIVADRAGMKVTGNYTISEEELLKSALIYEQSMTQVLRFHKMLKGELAEFDLEVSIDEGARDTTVEDHLFTAEFLHRNGIDFTSLAPKFPGQFQKGVDYEGDVNELARSLDLHAALCREMGGYRLSLHSGSDKFSIYPMFADTTGGEFHIKTSGTSWLQAVKVVAMQNLPLFMELYSLCLDNLEGSKKAYHVKITHADFPDEIPADVMTFYARPDVRQLFHISYGVLLDHKKTEIFDILYTHEPEHYAAVSSHIEEHLKLLF